MMCSQNGYPYNFEIYCGKNDERKTPLATHVVNTMLEPITDNDSHVIYFGNFFTSYQLLTDLKSKNIRACGSARQNRMNRCPLEESKSFRKKECGSLDYRSDGNALCEME